MENHHFLLKLSRLFPSSCQFKTLPDVADQILIKPCQIFHENDLSPFFRKTEKTEKVKKAISIINQSSSSNSGWFSSGTDAETDTFFSLSSNSGDSFRRRMAKKKMETIDELGRRTSFSSAEIVLSKRRRPKSRKDAGEITTEKSGEVFKEAEMGSDHVLAESYYSRNACHRPRRRRKTKKRELGWVMEESYAVEKSSSDPYEDFRASMVEMIVEKQIFGEEDLERLLICFLGLNQSCYHGIIVDVFSEIRRTLLCN